MAGAKSLGEISHAFITALETLGLNEIIRLRSLDRVPQVYPKSMDYLDMDTASYRAAYEAVLPYFNELKATIQCLITDEAFNKVVMHANSTATTTIGLYDNDYMFILHGVEDGYQITIIENYVDSFKAKEQDPTPRAAIIASRKEEAYA